MKKICVLLPLIALVSVGCFPEGEGKDKLIEPSSLMGPGGGETQDLTAPVAPMSGTTGTGTGSVFPPTDQPASTPAAD